MMLRTPLALRIKPTDERKVIARPATRVRRGESENSDRERQPKETSTHCNLRICTFSLSLPRFAAATLTKINALIRSSRRSSFPMPRSTIRSASTSGGQWRPRRCPLVRPRRPRRGRCPEPVSRKAKGLLLGARQGAASRKRGHCRTRRLAQKEKPPAAGGYFISLKRPPSTLIRNAERSS